MNVVHSESELATMKFGVGQPVPRGEDPVLLTGQGEYTDDINLEGQLYGYVVRSQVPHGVIKGIELDEARAMPGVVAIYTAADLDGFGSIPCVLPFKNRDGSDMHKPPRPGLAGDKVRFVGDPVAMVIAETQAQAKDAAELVVPEIEELPAVTDPVEAAQDGAPELYEGIANNVCLDFHFGDKEAADAAFAAAAHTTKLTLINNRVVVASMEPRSAIATYDPTEEKYTFYAGSQGAFGLRNALANAVLKVPTDKVRVITKNVGGSFGMKGGPYPEYFPLLHAAKQLGKPVKWVDERTGAFMSDHQGRSHVVTAEMAFDKDGHILALRTHGHADVGSYLTPVGAQPGTLNAVKNLISVYKTPVIDINTKCVFTNTSPIGPYRGAGRPEANYYIERLLETAAREMGIDRLEIRRRNQIQPEQIPYKAPSNMTYDSGDFPAVFEKAVAFSDWAGFAARKAESVGRGKLRGIGMSDYLEVTGPPGKEMGGLRFEKDGTVTIITGTLDYGQGHLTPFAQVLHQRTGIPFNRIRLLQGDSDELLVGGGTGGSKSMMSSGGAIIEAADVMIENGKQIAAHVLEAAVADIEFADGHFSIAGTDRVIGVMDLADKLNAGLELPEDVPPSLDVSLAHETGPSAFPNGCHVAEVEIDPDTGVVEIVRYSMVNDFGVVVNPMLVEGQAHGGILQGIGQALMEHVRYDDSGQLVTGSFMDYAMPRADNAPMFRYDEHPVPCTTNLVGAKGCGEAGCAGALGSIMNAVVDALGGKHIDMPATPERVWRAIHG
jgi:carbon-monoxide dehydrogenase large subunit